MKAWEQLPKELQVEEIRRYYDYLSKHKMALILKRCTDFLISCILFILLLPFLIIIGILVGTTSKGGVFFCQERITTYGRHFRIIKFRTMVADAEKNGSQVTTEGDNRITKAGRFLRKARLDELPQLINIIKGDMAIVGTRPEVPRYVDKYTNEMRATLLVPAGVTSRASILYKDEDRLLALGDDADTTYVEQVLPEKMKYNLEYLLEYTFAKDFKIMLQTVAAVWRK